MINDQRNVSDTLNDFYINVTSHPVVPDVIKEKDSVGEIVEHHCNHPSIEFIKNIVEIRDTVVFHLVSNDDVLKKFKSLNTTKATGCDNIPPRMIKMVAHCLSSHVTLLVNRGISEATFFLQMYSK